MKPGNLLKGHWFIGLVLLLVALVWSTYYSSRYEWRRYKERNAVRPLNPTDHTSYSIPLGRVPVSGNIEHVSIRVDCKAGSDEPVDFFLRHNDADLAQAKLPMLNAMDVDFTGLDRDVEKDDEISLKIFTPVWITNPTKVRVKLDKLPVRTSSIIIKSNVFYGVPKAIVRFH